MTSSVSLGLTGTTDAVLVQEPVSDQGIEQSAMDQAGSQLYSYVTEGRINGVPVDASDRALPIDREELLEAAFELTREPYAELLEINGSGDGLKRYNDILKRAYDGTAVIVSEDRQYDAASKSFIILLRYDSMMYKLCTRFNYLRDMLKDDAQNA